MNYMKEANAIPNLRSKQIISLTEKFVKDRLAGSEAGHDWWHIQRVFNNAKLISKTEKVDQLVVNLAALLHDIADSKFPT